MKDAALAAFLEPVIAIFVFTLARITAFILTFPMFRAGNMPRMVKVSMATSLTIAWMSYSLDRWSLPAADLTWATFGFFVIRESFLGALLGFGFGLFLLPARVAGAYISQEMGLSMSQLTDPGTGESSTVLSELFYAISVIVFLTSNLHLVLLRSLFRSLDHFPIGGGIDTTVLGQLPEALSDALDWGIQIAAPVGVVLFLLTVVLAVMMKAIPPFNLFTFGSAIRIAGGLLALFLFLPEIVQLIFRVLSHIQSIPLRFGLY